MTLKVVELSSMLELPEDSNLTNIDEARYNECFMASSSNGDNLTKKWADICLEEEEEHEVLFDDDCIEEEDTSFDDRWCLVGRLLSRKVSDFQIFQNIMADLWKPGKGITIKILEQNRFLFQFYHEIDVQRIIDGSPWTYDRKQLLLERLKPGENPRMVALNFIEMWVQIHELRPGFKTEWAIREAAKYIGTYVSSDPNNFQGVWRDYLRVRVKINVTEPLKRRMKFRSRNGDWFYAYFKYERVPTFCFICGIMGHAEKLCNKVYDIPASQIVKPYSLEMKAPLRRQNFLTASPWLRSGKVDHREANQEANPPADATSTGMNAMPKSQHKLHVNHDPMITQSHDTRNQENSHNDHFVLVNDNSASYSNEELIEIADLKRKRLNMVFSSGVVECQFEGNAAEVDTNKDLTTDVTNSKNLHKVGLGFQAHKAL
ncbi:hypothetical protein CsatB_010997 [Cannabis sativa]